MEFIIKNRRPASVFRFFEEISAIPRASFHEEAIASYLVDFAASRGLECYRDEMHNVLIKAPASKGYESYPPLLLQGHTDMVCEKNADVEHDFDKDPLDLYLDGKYLRARGTTLGGDNGIAVAVMLALLDGELDAHPAYECLFTTAEEVGLNGAHAFDYSRISARRMINLDSEEQGIVTAGCAGGIRSDLSLKTTAIPFQGECLRVEIKGLMGGHSGANIHCGRANANKLMGRILAALRAETPFSLVALSGGSKDNAIPRECVSTLAVPDAELAINVITEEAERIAEELCTDDRGFTVTCRTEADEATMLTREDTDAVITLLACAANGVLEMSRRVAGLVEFSRNLGVIEQTPDALSFVFSSRSCIDAQLDVSTRELDLLAARCGMSARHYSRYPGWSFAPVSPLRDRYLAVYESLTGKAAKVDIIHAGLECGVISSHLPDMDMISIGPDMKDIHSPDEALDLDSVEEFWRVLAEMIRKG